MKQVDFSDDKTLYNILATSLPMLLAQFMNLLYNIVDRIYIARIPKIGTTALGAVGLCFPLVMIIAAFTNMYGSGGSPLFAIARGRKDRKEAQLIIDLSFCLLIVTALFLTLAGEIFASPVLKIFGASDQAMTFALPYLRIYLLGNLFSMIATGMNPFINAQGFSTTGMTTVIIGAVANIILDPLFIFVFGWGIEGAAVATILSQFLSALFVLRFLFRKDSAYKVHILHLSDIRSHIRKIRDIIGLGLASFMMQLTNSLVQICCNSVLSQTGGDLYISVMTIINSARQMFETPILAITEGASPIISFNYGVGKKDRLKESIWIMFFLVLAYAVGVWIFIRLFPGLIINVFSSDKEIMKDAIPAFSLYFSTFIFMIFQYTGQTVFKSLGKKKHAIFFSLLRKGMIVIPLTYILPWFFHMGTDGVFAAEPISNVIGGLACFITMYFTVLKKIDSSDS